MYWEDVYLSTIKWHNGLDLVSGEKKNNLKRNKYKEDQRDDM